jgi:hypothetical protein
MELTARLAKGPKVKKCSVRGCGNVGVIVTLPGYQSQGVDFEYRGPGKYLHRGGIDGWESWVRSRVST